jgi:hypothetical protein
VTAVTLSHNRENSTSASVVTLNKSITAENGDATQSGGRRAVEHGIHVTRINRGKVFSAASVQRLDQHNGKRAETVLPVEAG